jgi:hypothetical protein
MRKYINKNGKLLFGKYKYKHLKNIPLHYLIWVQKTMYNEMSDIEKNKLDTSINISWGRLSKRKKNEDYLDYCKHTMLN